MIIDWKHLSTTKGYKSLKAAYISDVRKAAKERHPMRKKAEFLKLFNWVVNRAKHYAHHTGKSVEDILNGWEDKRTYWWLNYYQEYQQPKLHTKSLKPMGVKGVRNSYKTHNYLTAADRKHRVFNFIQHEQRDTSTKKKERWTTARKKTRY